MSTETEDGDSPATANRSISPQPASSTPGGTVRAIQQQHSF
jgi:hypothetical protein